MDPVSGEAEAVEDRCPAPEYAYGSLASAQALKGAAEREVVWVLVAGLEVGEPVGVRSRGALWRKHRVIWSRNLG